MPTNPNQVISTILRHDAKVTSYKIALLRAIGDVVLSYPDLRNYDNDVAIPLRLLAEFWVAYYWPFVDPHRPILQGPRAQAQAARTSKSDMAFREPLTNFRLQWEAVMSGQSRPSDGFYVTNELRVARKRAHYPTSLLTTYTRALASISNTIQMPIRYAGPGQWTIFSRPAPYRNLTNVTPVPGTTTSDTCLVIPAALWHSFRDLSLWIEALCIHEWCLFTERVAQEGHAPIDRGEVYRLLTDRPDNRRPLTWERNNIDILLIEGHQFICPWTERRITHGIDYAVDHLLPVTIYPINELWNLVRSDPHFNSHIKRDRLPSQTRLTRAIPHLALAYSNYQLSKRLAPAIHEDSSIRFSNLHSTATTFTNDLALAVTDFLAQVALTRNLAQF